ncbi:MAG: lipid-A-disaccharide synthase [Bacteroidota bacterium]
MRYYLISGEASGDLHGSNLIRELVRMDPEAEVRAWGGDLCAAAGAEVVKHYRDLAFMGFLEVAKNIRTILRNIKFCKSDIEAFQPDALILVDYPGFNLRIAKWAKAAGFKVFYYISPQVWAWNTGRVHKMKQIIDNLFVILPFEPAFYRSFDMSVEFVGHPLMDVIPNYPHRTDFRAENLLATDKPIIALLPGSRKQEIKRMLPEMLSVVDDFPDYEFVVAGAPAIPDEFYRALLAGASVKIVGNQTYDLLKEAEYALVTSGTATLETGMFGVPQIVCYTGNRWSYLLAKRLIKVDYICLVNLILDRPLLKELIQNELNRANLKAAIQELEQADKRQEIESGYRELMVVLGKPGASARVGQKVVASMKKPATPLDSRT